MVDKKVEKIRSIGKRYTIRLNNDETVEIIYFYNGRTQIYILEDDKIKNFLDLDENEAKEIGLILCGLGDEEIESIIKHKILMDWFIIKSNFHCINKSIEELQIRKRSGATIAAIERDKKTILSPSPKEKLKEGDKILLIGDIPSIEKAKMILING